MAGKAPTAGPAPVWPPPEEDLEIPKETKAEEEVWLTAVSPDDYPNEDTCKTFIFREEGHTFGNALRYVISNYPEVKYCAYTLPHPAEKVMHLRIQTVPGILPQDILARGLNDLHELADVILKKFTDEVKKCPSSEPAPEPELPIPKFGVEYDEDEPAFAAVRARDTFTKTTEISPDHPPIKQEAPFSYGGQSASGSKTFGKEAQALRKEQIAQQDAQREGTRLKNLEKRKAQQAKHSEDMAATLAKMEIEKLAKEKQAKEEAEVLARFKLDYQQSDHESSEEVEEPKAPSPVPSSPESEPELVNIADDSSESD